MQRSGPIPALITAAWLAAIPASSDAGTLSRDLERALATRGTHADIAVIVRFADPVDLQPLAVGDRSKRDNRVLVALKEREARNRATVDAFLAAQGAVRVRDLWIINGVAAILPAVSVKRLAEHPKVERIDLDSFVQGGRTRRMATRPASDRALAPSSPIEPAAAEASSTRASVVPAWNVAAVRAPELWALGQAGKGIVIASMDSGVDLAHPDLRTRWRGGTNSWFDPHGEEAAPVDRLGHGTQAIGVAVGGAGLGVAPDARWIAVKLYDADGRARMSDIHLAFQWLMDPDGDPATLDAPDVVNASWTLSGRGAGQCILEFHEDLQALRSAGVAVILAAGNDGPAPGTSNSPGNNPGAFAVGAVDRDLEAARQASRGPSACGGGIFPQLVAPGVNVRTADVSYGGLPSYATVSGTSLAAPHVAGVLALLAGAYPDASLDGLEAALVRTARDLGATGADDSYGHGLVDAVAAFNALRDARQSAATGARAADGQPDGDGRPSSSTLRIKPTSPNLASGTSIPAATIVPSRRVQ